MTNLKKILLGLAIILTLINFYSLTQCYLLKSQLRRSDQIIKAQQINVKIVAFTQLFIDKVLSGQTEVSFEDRLQLENSVRDINDPEIFDQWQKFVKSGINEEGQQNLTLLLKLLIKKISY